MRIRHFVDCFIRSVKQVGNQISLLYSCCGHGLAFAMSCVCLCVCVCVTLVYCD